VKNITNYEGLFRLTFPDGSVLNGCRKRSYVTSPHISWFLFYGRQFTTLELERWNVTIEQLDGPIEKRDRKEWWNSPCPRCGAKAGEWCLRLKGKWYGGTTVPQPHPERKELAKRAAEQQEAK
jgi:hypothetical protein